MPDLIHCYLCGKPGADSKDHVPPKCLLPDAPANVQRITVPAHRICNSAASADEEYVRDLLIMEGEALGLPQAALHTKKIWKAWTREGGYRRYQRIISTAVPIELKTASGLYAGRAIGVAPDVVKIKSVGRKIIQGIVHHDTGAILDPTKVMAVPIPKKDFISDSMAKADEPYFQALKSEGCLHDMFSENVAIRRGYVYFLDDSGARMIHLVSMTLLWACVIVGETIFAFDEITKPKLTLLVWNGSSSR